MKLVERELLPGFVVSELNLFMLQNRRARLISLRRHYPHQVQGVVHFLSLRQHCLANVGPLSHPAPPLLSRETTARRA